MKLLAIIHELESETSSQHCTKCKVINEIISEERIVKYVDRRHVSYKDGIIKSTKV